MIDIFEFKNKLFPAEELGLNLHTKSKNPRRKNTNTNADFSTSIFQRMPKICLSKPWIYLFIIIIIFFWLLWPMTSLYSSFCDIKTCKKNYNYS